MKCAGACNYNGVISRVYMHDLKGGAFLMAGNVTLQSSYLARSRSTAAMHLQMWSYRGGTAIIRWKYFRGHAWHGPIRPASRHRHQPRSLRACFWLVEGPCATECGSSAFPVVDDVGVIHGLKFFNNTILGFMEIPAIRNSASNWRMTHSLPPPTASGMACRNWPPPAASPNT